MRDGEEERQDGWLRRLREKNQEPGIRLGPNPKTNDKTKNYVPGRKRRTKSGDNDAEKKD